VEAATDAPLRVVLDTSVVRKLSHADADAIDVASLLALPGRPPFSIADGAVLELLDDLVNGALTFERWRATTATLKPLLDPAMPVAPGGRDLAEIWGGGPGPRHDGIDAARHSREIWQHLSVAVNERDLTRRHVYVQHDGVAIEVQLIAHRVPANVESAGAFYAGWFPRIVADARGKERDEIAALILAGLSSKMGLTDALRLDLATRYMASRAADAARRKGAYKPTRNDALDLELLFTIPMPAIVCTNDKKFVRVVRSLGSPDGRLVLTPAELLDGLRGD